MNRLEMIKKLEERLSTAPPAVEKEIRDDLHRLRQEITKSREFILSRKVSEGIPLLQPIAEEHGLNLSSSIGFNKCIDLYSYSYGEVKG